MKNEHISCLLESAEISLFITFGNTSSPSEHQMNRCDKWYRHGARSQILLDRKLVCKWPPRSCGNPWTPDMSDRRATRQTSIAESYFKSLLVLARRDCFHQKLPAKFCQIVLSPNGHFLIFIPVAVSNYTHKMLFFWSWGNKLRQNIFVCELFPHQNAYRVRPVLHSVLERLTTEVNFTNEPMKQSGNIAQPRVDTL